MTFATHSAPNGLAATALPCRVRSRNLAVVLETALGAYGTPTRTRLVRYVAQVFDDRHAPVLASAGDLTPYAAELLGNEVLRASHGSRIDLFVAPEAGVALRDLICRIGGIADGGLDIRVHEASGEPPEY